MASHAHRFGLESSGIEGLCALLTISLVSLAFPPPHR